MFSYMSEAPNVCASVCVEMINSIHHVCVLDTCVEVEGANIWPEAKNILCQFHLLQALWRWLLAGAHGIAKKDRPHLFFLFRALVYSETSSEFEEAKEKLKEDDIFNAYPNFEDHIDRLYLQRVEAWASHVRLEQKYPNYNVNTTNYLESSFRVTKDIDFHRHKAHNLPDLVRHFLESESGYWVKKLIDHIALQYQNIVRSSKKYIRL